MRGHRRAIGPAACEVYASFKQVQRLAQCQQGQADQRRFTVANLLRAVWQDDQGHDVAEYAVMLAVILVIVIGTVRLIGSHADTIFSQVGSSIQ